MAKQLKISADTSEVRKSILDLGKTMKGELGKSNIEIFSKDTKQFLRTEAVKGAELLKGKMDKIAESVVKHQKALEKVKQGSKEELRIKEKILNATKRIAELDKDRGGLSSVAQGLEDPKAPGGMRGILSKIPGLGSLGKGAGAAMGGGIFGRALGMMGRLGPLGLLGGAVGGAGLYGLSRARAGFKTFEGGIGDRVQLGGRGITDMTPNDPDRLARAGMNALSLRSARMRDVDVFGRSGATQESVMRRAEFERNFGVQSGTLSGMGGQLRGVMGGKGADKSVMAIQAALIASGITDEIGPYLETTANMLTQLNERGFTFDDSALALFNSIVDRNQNIERTNRLIGNVDQGIRGSTGEANAFFQTAFGKAGIGGGTIGGAQAAIRTGGLFGMNLEKNPLLQGTADAGAFQAMGIGGKTMQRVASATVGMLDQMFGSESEIKKQLNDPETRQAAAQRQMSRQRLIMRTFGLTDEGQAAEVNQLLREAANPETSGKRQANIQKRLKDVKEGNTELGNLKAINKSSAGMLDVLKNKRISIEDAIGEQMAPVMVTMRDTLLSIDKMILDILMGIAKIIPGMETPQSRYEQALEGDKVITDEKAKELASRPKSQFIKESSKFVGKELEIKEEIGRLKKRRDAGQLGPNMEMAVGGIIKNLEKQLKNLQDSQEKAMEAYKEQVELQRKQVQLTEKNVKVNSDVAKNTKDAKGGIPNGTSE